MRKSPFAVILAFLGLFYFVSATNADELQIKSSHPDRYVVQEGDTLWAISGRFLENPWQWPQIWDYNQQIKNPHLIFPGDVLTLVWVNGKPQIQVNRGKLASTIKLSPYVRKTPIDNAITTIPLEAVKPFVQMHRFIQPKSLKKAPYVVGGADSRVLMGKDSKLYARGKFEEEVKRYFVFREGKFYKHPQTREKLGLHVQQIGEVSLLNRKDDVATFYVENARTGILKGDYLLPANEDSLQAFFQPKPVVDDINATIMDVEKGVLNVGLFDVVLIDAGTREGVEVGSVFAVKKHGDRIIDPVKNKWLELPDELAGTLMVFKTFEKISYGLVMSAARPLSVGDKLAAP